jgi:copper chaperone
VWGTPLGYRYASLDGTPWGYLTIDRTAASGVAEKVYTVSGMTCEHCVNAVSAEVSSVPGVAAVNVDLARGQVTVIGDGYADEQIRDAVDEAGYAVVD